MQAVVGKTNVNLWKSTQEVLKWYCDFHDKQDGYFISFDIVEFYPSITEKLLLKAINFASQYTNIESYEKDIIIHTKRKIVFDNGEPREKKDSKNGFDIYNGKLW